MTTKKGQIELMIKKSNVRASVRNIATNTYSITFPDYDGVVVSWKVVATPGNKFLLVAYKDNYNTLGRWEKLRPTSLEPRLREVAADMD